MGEVLLFHKLFTHSSGKGISHDRRKELLPVQYLLQLSDFCPLHLLKAYRKC